MSQIVDIHVGVSSGMAFCGNVGSASRCEYCMVGDSVNMAARYVPVRGVFEDTGSVDVRHVLLGQVETLN